MRFLALTCLFFLCIHSTFAIPLNDTTPSFDVKKANQQFDHINLQLSVQNLNVQHLKTAVVTLEELISGADQCVEDMQTKLNNVDTLIKQDNTAENKQGADLIYLNHQQKTLADEQAQCRLFSIRAKEATEAYKTAIAQLKQEEALARGIPLWKTIGQEVNAPPEMNLLSTLTSISMALPPLLLWLGIISFALVAALATLYKLRKSRFVRRLLRFKPLYISYIFLLTIFFISGALFAYFLILSQDPTTADLPLMLSGLGFLYLSSLLFTIVVFNRVKVRAFFYWYSLENCFFENLTVTVISFYTLFLLGHLFATTFNPHSPLWQLSQSLFLLITLATTALFIYSFCKTHRHIKFIKRHKHFILRVSALLLIACALIDSLGYHTLAHYLIFSGLTTFAILFVTLLAYQGINKLYLTLNQQQSTKAMIIKYFGYRHDQVFTEFLILKTTAQILVIAFSVYLISLSWGFATDSIENIYDQLIHGVHVINMTFYPTRIIAGLVIFCLLYLVFRSISTTISRRQQFEDEEETQVAVASILTYIGFGFALISGLLVAGFDFTGLAIIAGALSVGIGLGLQSIVNNFVSGLILLIEKPIKPGDRINIDGVEGFVKKIRVRSTQLISPAREDIIVPNSDLITHRVINYMFSDKFYHINCSVGVAYGSDTLLVRDVLLAIANNHEEIIKTGRNKPTVLFSSFADSNLMFQLSCLIKDVNKKGMVHSELNFAIERAFREHHIEMAYPQQDIHIKLNDLAPLVSTMPVNQSD